MHVDLKVEIDPAEAGFDGARLGRLGGKPVDGTLVQHSIDPRIHIEREERPQVRRPVDGHLDELAHLIREETIHPPHAAMSLTNR